MNSLEFIEEEIEGIDKHINYLKEKIIEDAIYEGLVNQYKKDLQDLEGIKKRLQQIKVELEAWEICKNKLNLKVQTEEAVTEGFCMKGYWLLVKQYPYTQTTILEQEEYEILKKALEVEDEI